MRVLSIVHVLSSFGVGGQERVALDLAAGQVRRGHRVSAISLAPPPDGPIGAELRDAGATLATVPKRGGTDPTLTARLAWQLRKLGADVVHTHNPLPLIYATPAARLIGAVGIHTKHGLNPGSRGQRLLRRAAARLLDSFVAVSDVTAAQAREARDCAPEQLVVIANGIRLERFHPDPDARAIARAELGITPDAWVVGTVGRVDEVKNQVMLVAAMAPMLDRADLVIIGDGPAREALDAAVGALIAPARARVHVLGRRMDVDRLLPALDVFALSSVSEGLPLVVPEAMATGLPVVSTAVGGIPTVVEDGVTGLLVPVDMKAMRDALAGLAAVPARARAIGARAREVALTRYSAERMIDDYLALYERALARRRT
jgi:glycosyltransferase involved in cell wall biosynthesis